jgi:hypothetical protein
LEYCNRYGNTAARARKYPVTRRRIKIDYVHTQAMCAGTAKPQDLQASSSTTLAPYETLGKSESWLVVQRCGPVQKPGVCVVGSAERGCVSYFGIYGIRRDVAGTPHAFSRPPNALSRTSHENRLRASPVGLGNTTRTWDLWMREATVCSSQAGSRSPLDSSILLQKRVRRDLAWLGVVRQSQPCFGLQHSDLVWWSGAGIRRVAASCLPTT